MIVFFVVFWNSHSNFCFSGISPALYESQTRQGAIAKMLMGLMSSNV